MRYSADRAGLAVGLIAAAAIGLTAIGTGAPASAQDDPVAPVNPLPVTPVCGGSGDIDDGGGAVFGSCFGNTPGRGPSIEVSSAQVWAWYGCDQWRAWAPGSTVSAVSSQGELVPEDILARGLDPTATYTWNTVECTYVGADGTTEVWGWGLLVIETSPPIDPLVLRDRARDRIDPEAPVPMTAPMWGEIPAVVQLPTWLWVDGEWEPIEESESQGLVTVVVQARPVQVAWALGEHGGVTCDGPGTEWAPGLGEDATDCAYTFDASGAGVASAATVQWTFRWWLNGNDMGDFGDLTVTTDFAIDVAEIQAIETS